MGAMLRQRKRTLVKDLSKVKSEFDRYKHFVKRFANAKQILAMLMHRKRELEQDLSRVKGELDRYKHFVKRFFVNTHDLSDSMQIRILKEIVDFLLGGNDAGPRRL